MPNSKLDILQYSLPDLQEQFDSLGIERFRAQQIYRWLWKNHVDSFDQMANISAQVAKILSDKFSIPRIEISNYQKSSDGTIKVGFSTSDRHTIEGVIIPTEDRITACISSQIGCSLSCNFCATGMLGRKRNLWAHEIFDQVFLLNKISLEHFSRPLTNIVYMGMGEPLLNYREVLRSLKLLNDTDLAMGLAARRITVSTSGIVNNILKLAEEDIKINLALSLHAPTNHQRNNIMDINKTNPIEDVLAALKHYYTKTKNKITFEYVLLGGFNDSEADAIVLASLCKDFPVYVNLIEYNPVDGSPHIRCKKETRDHFLATLRKLGVKSKVRKSRGKDIDAACGQLANKIERLKKSTIE